MFDRVTGIIDDDGYVFAAEDAGLIGHPEKLQSYFDNHCKVYCFCRFCDGMHEVRERCECGAETLIEGWKI